MFIAFAPYKNPEIVIAVAIENVEKGGGGTNAGPVARQIMDQYFGDRVITSTDSQQSKVSNKNNHNTHNHQQHVTLNNVPTTTNRQETD